MKKFSAVVAAGAMTLGLTGMATAASASADDATPTSASSQGCSFGQGGDKAGSLCWIDMSQFGDVTAADLSNGPVTKPLDITVGHYEITANATVSAGADGANGVSASSLPTWGGSVLGNTIDGNEYYAGTQGDPALYQMDSDSTLLDHGNAQRDTVKLDGIKLVDKSTGLQISDHFSIIMADAESTGTGEGFTFSSDKPLNELMKVVPQGWDQPCTQTYDGLGTNQVTCVSKANQTTGGRGIAMVGANAPSTAQASFVNDKQGSHSREGVAFAVLFTNIAVPGTQVNQAQDANGNSVTDATFTTKAVRGTPGEGAELGESSSNGAVNTSSNPFMIGTDYVTYSVAKSSGNTPEGAYSVKWDCSLNGDPVSNADLQPSTDGRTVKLMTPQPTEDFGTTTSACTATLTAEPPTTGPGEKTVNPTDQPIDLGDLQTAKGNAPEAAPVTQAAFVENGTDTLKTDLGVWKLQVVDGKAVATFTPKDDTVTGEIPPVKYTVTDGNGLQSAQAQLKVTINQPPTTDNASQTINPNDTATLNPASTKGTGDIADVKLVAPADPSKGSLSPDGKTLTVPGEGVWTIALQDGKVVSTFTPVKDYTGKVDSQQYVVTDSNNLPSNKGKLNVTINVPPKTGDDSQTINPNQTATLNPESTKGTGDITDVKFADGSTTKTVDGQGTWTIGLQDGKVVSTFTPVKAYTGKVDSQQYAVTDSNNLPSNKGTLNVTINQPPTTGDAAKTINPNETATLTPKTTSGSSPIKSVVFDNGKTTKDVPGQGTWSVKLVKGQPVAMFTPIKDYDGKVDSQPYTVTDGNGLPATGKLDVTINTPPTTGDDSKVINPNETAKLAPVTKPGSGDITSVAFDNGKDTKTVDGQGTWTVKLVDGQPAAEFAPAKDYTGKVDSQQYTVTDANKLTATGTLNVTINTTPTTGDKSATTNPETPVTLNPVTAPGSAPIKSVAFDNGQPSKDVPNEGTWTVTLDGKGQPVVVFTPVKGFTGKTTEQPYTVTDGNGLTATGKLDVTVNTPPTTGDGTKTVEPGATATFAPADLSTKSGSNKDLSYTLLDPATGKPVASYTDAHGGVWTLNPTTGEATYAASKDYRGPVDSVAYRVTDGNGLTADGKLNIIVPPAASDQTLSGDRGEAVTFDPKANLVTTGSNPDVTISLKTPDANDPNAKTIFGKGKWTLDPKTGKITFTPEGDYAGPVPSVDYVATDTANKLSATGQLNVIYPPAAGDAQKVIQPGDTAAFGPSDLGVKPGSGDITSYTLIDPKTDKPVASYTDAHGGVWTIDPKSGATTYKSNPDYRGPVDPIKYQTTDANGKTAEGTLSILIPPAAGDQSKTVNPGQSASFDPKADLVTPGTNPSTTISFTDPDSKSPNTKTVPGEGKWTLDPKTGKITFTPEPGFIKDPTPINYRVTDEKNNLTDTGTLTVHVNQPPTAGDKTVTVNPGNPATLDPVITPGTSKDMNVSFKDHDSNDPAKKTVPGEGVWTIDPKTGKSTFTPEPGFTKDPTPVHYVVTDGNKLTGDGTLTVHVNQPPTAKPQTKETKPGKSVEFDPIKNLVKPGTSTDLKITLLDPKTGKPVDGNTVLVPGVGTWTVNPNTGKVTFAPAPGYHGTIQIGYRVTDGNGLSADSTLSVKVPAAPVTPTTPAKPAPSAPAKPAPAKQPQSVLATTGASVGIALVAMLALAAAGLGLRKLSRRNGSD
ncbi:Ig-like domain-containing protein [Bifidobacterium tibiigranuli]|uniref:Ig-like domain-containing protein n=1 Tax=Bifidobacterium tibiigranuli TaxID=2172043 RepID=UPI0013869F97|nr:cadherin-like domain-containing protein [Bifidobacterium tibiigranuli]